MNLWTDLFTNIHFSDDLVKEYSLILFSFFIIIMWIGFYFWKTRNNEDIMTREIIRWGERWWEMVGRVDVLPAVVPAISLTMFLVVVTTWRVLWMKRQEINRFQNEATTNGLPPLPWRRHRCRCFCLARWKYLTATARNLERLSTWVWNGGEEGEKRERERGRDQTREKISY